MNSIKYAFAAAIVAVLVNACAPVIQVPGGTGGAGGGAAATGSGGTSTSTGPTIQPCTSGLTCASACCWAWVCADVGDTICADHGVSPDQCGKCVN